MLILYSEPQPRFEALPSLTMTSRKYAHSLWISSDSIDGIIKDKVGFRVEEWTRSGFGFWMLADAWVC